jgi:hypothetical protein
MNRKYAMVLAASITSFPFGSAWAYSANGDGAICPPVNGLFTPTAAVVTDQADAPRKAEHGQQYACSGCCTAKQKKANARAVAKGQQAIFC